MTARVSPVLGTAGTRVGYVYDFGSSTELVISHGRAVEAARAPRTRLVARNEPPVWPCDECGKPAENLCTQCAYDGRGFCCGVHSASHDCGEEMQLPVVNSPRMGVCGYVGEV